VCRNWYCSITGLSCNNFDIIEFVDDYDSSLSDLESDLVPLSKNNIVVTLAAKERVVVPSKIGVQDDAFAVIMQAAQPKPVQFLPISALDESASIQDQLASGLESLCLDLELGYKCNESEKQLKQNISKIKDVLCFVQKHWKTFFRRDFPSLPLNETRQNRLLQVLATCTRTGGNSNVR
jgi:hypothetical protein